MYILCLESSKKAGFRLKNIVIARKLVTCAGANVYFGRPLPKSMANKAC